MDSALFGPIHPEPSSSGQTALGISSATAKVAFIGKAWWAGADASKTIERVWLSIPSRTVGSPASTFRISFQGIDTVSSTAPGRPDGVISQSWTVSTSALSAGILTTPVGSFSKSVNRGETLCVVMDFSTFGSGSDVTFRGMTVTKDGTFPFWTSFNGSSWQSIATNVPSIGFTFTDGTYGTMAGAWPFESAATNSIAGILTTSLDSGNERGIKWVPARSGTLTAATISLSIFNSAADFSVNVYRDTTLLDSVSVDVSTLNATSYFTQLAIPFNTTIPFSAGDNLYVTVKSLGAQTPQIQSALLFNAGFQTLLAGGENVSWAHRNGGAWATTTDRDRKITPHIVLRGQYATTGISGTHTISGIATINGTPATSATVTCFRPSDGGSLTTTTNENGAYSFSVAGGHTYHVFIEKETGGVKYNAKSLWGITPVAP